jgi:tRNA pseudouridine38-40 synthase
MPNYRLLIEYEGTRYSGWQTQGNTPRTIQGNLIRAAREVYNRVDVGGSGRTDAGVHAIGQVAHLKIKETVAPLDLVRALNDRLPHDICVLDAAPAPESFHARHDATSRVYLYQISRRRTAFAKPFVWWIKDRLDARAMSEACAGLAGMHDFSLFTDRRNEAESTKVLVDSAELGGDGDLLLFRIAASHYLWKMVRKLVAALVEVGRGNMAPDEMLALVDCEGSRFEPTAPPSGLFLEAVTFGREAFDRPLAPVVPVASTPAAGRGRRR